MNKKDFIKGVLKIGSPKFKPGQTAKWDHYSVTILKVVDVSDWTLKGPDWRYLIHSPNHVNVDTVDGIKGTMLLEQYLS